MASNKIKKIVEIAKEKIDAAGCRTVDRIAKQYCDMLFELDEEDAAMEVYEHYNES